MKGGFIGQNVRLLTDIMEYTEAKKLPGILYSTANDPQPQIIPRPQMIPKMDRKWSSTASDPQK